MPRQASPGHSGSQTERVAGAIRQRIAARRLGPGDRLPSIRAMAGAMAVSASTVVEAYDRLAAEGAIRARRGAGFFVSQSATLPPLSLVDRRAGQERDIVPFWVSSHSLDADPAALKPGCGWLPPHWMPADPIRKALRSLARGGDATLTDYGPTRGSAALRRLLAARCAADGLEVAPDQILLTGSATQAVDLICRLLLRPGDTVMVDDPCYFNFRALLRAHQVAIVGVPWTLAGPDIETFERLAAASTPRLYLTNSALHNPTGATMSAQVAHRLLVKAAAHDMTIIEDDTFVDFEPDPSPRLAVLDGLERVIRVGSFTKTLSASARCGFVVARPGWVDELVNLQLASNFGGPSPISAELVAQLLAGGFYRKHVEELRRKLAKAQRETVARLAVVGIEPWTTPRGGFNLWCSLPGEVDSAEMARRALDDGVVLAPGNVYSASQSAANFMRFNVAQCGGVGLTAKLERAMNRAMLARG